jgi:complement component 1 Q subcomponent-binding protein, mitochondrial
MIYTPAAPLQPSVALQLISRHLSSSRHCAAFHDLLKNEISVEEEGSKADDNALENPPAGWSIEVKPEDTLMTLRQKSQQGEDVAIKISTNSQDDSIEEMEEGEDEAAAPSYAINFWTEVSKGGKTLRFNLTYMENETAGPDIEHIELLNEGQDSNDEHLYTGPVFAELDEQVQQQFAAYLEERGITADVCQYLCKLVYDKEQAEYLRWMKKVADFVR